MLEGFSDEAHTVVGAAADQAAQLGHPLIGTEHLLLGLLCAEDSLPASLLRQSGATITAAHHKIGELSAAPTGTGQAGTGQPSFTARAQRALERAGRFSRQQRASEVSAGHVLLGVLDVEGLACQVLRGLGVDLGRLRDAVATNQSELPPARTVAAPAASAMATDDDPVGSDLPMVRCANCHADLADTLTVSALAARRDDGSLGMVDVVSCGACGVAVGALPAHARRRATSKASDDHGELPHA